VNSAPPTVPGDVFAWLDGRTPAAPPALRVRMNASLAAVQGTSIASVLGEAALHALELAVEQCDERSAAVDLLAADALLTYAMEAAAEHGADTIEAVAMAYGGSRLVQLIPENA
jgi:hypothetical protein